MPGRLACTSSVNGHLQRRDAIRGCSLQRGARFNEQGKRLLDHQHNEALC